MKCPFVIKKCSKCDRLLVANTMNFGKKKDGKWGLNSVCKKCKKQHYKNNKEEILKKQKEYSEKNKEKIVEYQKQWYQNNKEYCSEKSKQYREKHIDEIKDKNKEWRINNQKELKEKRKKYNKENPHISFNNNNKRRQLEDSQGEGISKEQWLEMMNFFEWKCAYSGITLSKETRSIDHITPLSKNGEHEPWNCVPMIKNYNRSKNAKDFLEWYKQQEFYSEERLDKIYQWQKYAYNKWGGNDGKEG